MNQTGNFYYEFGQYRLEPANKLLFRESSLVKLPPKLFETLLALVENTGKTITKEELLSRIWSDTIVEESNLSQNIFHLRKILGDQNNGFEYIETVPKFGYRFVAKVDFISKENESSKSALNKTISTAQNSQNSFSQGLINLFKLKTKQIPIILFVVPFFLLVFSFWALFSNQKSSIKKAEKIRHSIAVLPFKQIGENKIDEQLQIGMSDSLTTKLGNLPQIIVRPTNTVILAKQTEPQQIGRELKVDSVLTGVVQKSDEQIRITVQLVNVSDGRTIWAEKYDLSEKSIFDLQDNISEKILQALNVQISPDETRKITKRFTGNLEAFEAYSRGRFFLNKRSEKNLDKAVSYFRQAINIDPKFALAYSELATTELILASNNTGTEIGKEKQKQAKINALKAVENDSELGEPHAVLASILYNEGGSREETEKAYQKAIELNPNYVTAHHWYAWFLFLDGKFDEAEREMKKAYQLDPILFSTNYALGQIYFFTKRYELALTQFQKTVELEPNDILANSFYAITLAHLGKTEEAIIHLERIEKTDENIRPTLGYVLAISGKTNKAHRILTELEQVQNSSGFEKYGKSLIYLALGEKEKSLELLKKISTSRNGLIQIRFKFDPRLDALRGEAEFKKILQNLT